MSFVGPARLIGSVTLLSRILGLARDMLVSHFLGAGMVWDAFALANRVPNLFRRLFGEGALTAAFVPAFVRKLQQDRREEAFLLLRRLITALALLLTLIIAAGIAVTFTFPTDPKSSLEGEYLRIMLPYLALICVGAILGAALNGLRHFFAPAFAPVLANIVSILALLSFAGLSGEKLGRVLAWSVLVAGVLQLLSMALPLARRGASFRPDFAPRDPALREVGVTFAPLVLGLSLVQINEFLNTVIARFCVPGDGAVSALYYGNQFLQLPLSLVGTAVGTAIFPAMAAAAANRQPVELSSLLQKGLRGTIYLSVPASVGLIVFSAPIIELFFQHGAFTAEHTARAARVMIFYSLSLWCYCANQVQVRAFYAQGDTRTPVRVSASMVALTLGLSLVLVRVMDEAGIALATSVGGFLSFAILQFLLRRRMAVSYLPVARTFGLSLLASAAMAGAGCAARWAMPDSLGRLLRLAVPIGLAVGVYFAITLALRLDEARRVLPRRPSKEDA